MPAPGGRSPPCLLERTFYDLSIPPSSDCVRSRPGGHPSGGRQCASAVAGDNYPYGGPAFTRLVADSDRVAGAGTPQDFYRWMDRAPLAQQSGGLLTLTAAERKKLARLPSPALKTEEEKAFCTSLHRMVKAYMPNFSLDEGFEFTNAVTKGERQCLLQSVILAGLLQRAGIDAGIVMVWRNLHGQATNNSHCVTLVHLPDGKDVELDASDPIPFVRHQGLLGEQDGLRDVEPIFAGDSPAITGYKASGTGHRLMTRQVRPLDYNFVGSQFNYYRGERPPAGCSPRRSLPPACRPRPITCTPRSGETPETRWPFTCWAVSR